MRVLKQVSFDEVLSCYKCENFRSKSFEYAAGVLGTANKQVAGKWVLVGLSRKEILNIMLPDHNEPREKVIIPKPGLVVSVAAERIKGVTGEIGPCWENILSPKNRDFSRTTIFL